jgi:hypothetical protein
VPNNEGVDRCSGVIVDVSHDKQMYYRRKKEVSQDAIPNEEVRG